MKTSRKIELGENYNLLDIFGPYDRYLKLIRHHFNIKINLKHNVLKLTGEKKSVNRAVCILEQLLNTAQTRPAPLTEEEIIKLINTVERSGDKTGWVSGIRTCLVGRRSGSKTPVMTESNDFSAEPSGLSKIPVDVKARTAGQERYIKTLEKYDIVFCIGPAGTGKTYLAVARALKSLQSGEVKRIILARPAVEAGERLGFLPGSYEEKVNPYLRPLYDAAESFLSYQQLKRLMETDVIEVIPLAYMRGRNLGDAFIILDEAQNTTSDQMKMFLTRMGTGSRIVTTGDITQIDLPPGKISGLVEVQGMLNEVPGIAFCYLTKADIVRHPLVQAIVEAYESKSKYQKKKQK
ncbi:MAG: PhoH family protein [Planctomycetota bacterium]